MSGTHSFSVNGTDTTSFPPYTSGALNVRSYGAKGDGTADDTAAIAAAIAAAKILGMPVYFPRPAVAYMVQPQTYAYSSTFPAWTGVFDIDFSVTLFGDPGGTPIRLRTYGGGNPDTAFGLVSRYATDSQSPFGPLTPPAAWASGHVYAGGDEVTAPNGHTYKTFAGGTSGVRPPADLSPATCGAVSDGGITDWALTDYVWRGVMFRIKSFAINADPPPTNIVFRDLILDGQAPRNNVLWRMDVNPIPNHSEPYDRAGLGYGGATVPAGAGWDNQHRPIGFAPPYTYGNVLVENCKLINWRSETLYMSQGSGNAGKLTLRHVLIDNCQADAISVTGPLEAQDVEVSNCGQAVENEPSIYPQHFTGLYVHDCGMGVVMVGLVNTVDRRQTVIENSLIERCSQAGIYITDRLANVTIRQTKLVDCNQIAGTWGAVALLVGTTGVTPSQCLLEDVEVIADKLGGGVAFLITATGIGNKLHRCKTLQSSYAAAHGIFAGTGLGGGTAGTGDELEVLDPDLRGSANAGSLTSGGGNIVIRGARIDGLFVTAAPNLDPRRYNYYEFKPGSPATLTTPQNFAVGVPTRIVGNHNLTIQHGANIVMVGNADYTPGTNGGEISFVRPSSASDRVVEIPGSRFDY